MEPEFPACVSALAADCEDREAAFVDSPGAAVPASCVCGSVLLGCAS